jgi:hypothetical protein
LCTLSADYNYDMQILYCFIFYKIILIYQCKIIIELQYFIPIVVREKYMRIIEKQISINFPDKIIFDKDSVISYSTAMCSSCRCFIQKKRTRCTSIITKEAIPDVSINDFCFLLTVLFLFSLTTINNCARLSITRTNTSRKKTNEYWRTQHQSFFFLHFRIFNWTVSVCAQPNKENIRSERYFSYEISIIQKSSQVLFKTLLLTRWRYSCLNLRRERSLLSNFVYQWRCDWKKILLHQPWTKTLLLKYSHESSFF